MATNLLLEGEDLEALLARAHAEGGTRARIVRAEKVRRGGLLGFFAREAFEVAVEIPAEGDDLGDGPDLAGSAADGGGPAAAPAAAFRREQLEIITEPAQREVPAARYPAAESESGGPTAADLEAELEAELDALDPGRFAASGLASMAERVSAAEEAATAELAQRVSRRTVLPRVDLATAYGAARPASGTASKAVGSKAAGTNGSGTSGQSPGAPGQSPAVAVLERQLQAQAAQSMASILGAPARRQQVPEQQVPERPVPEQQVPERPVPERPVPERPVPERPVPEQPVLRRLVPDPVELRPAAPRAFVPHEPPVNPVQPSTARPAFSALLDSLRGVSTEDGAPARVIVPASTEQGPPPRQPPVTVTSTTIDQALELRRGDRFIAQLPAVHPPAPDPGWALPQPAPESAPITWPSAAVEPHPAMPVPVTAVTAVTAPAPADCLSAEILLAADRRVLRGLGVPASWTRRMRAGDRFSSVLRMMSRMPALAIDPEAPAVAVVGLRDEVVLEAHRVAIDLAAGTTPRPVVVVPAQGSLEHDTAVVEARTLHELVAAVVVDDHGLIGAEKAHATLREIRAHAVIAVVDAKRPLRDNAAWVEAIGRVDALVVVNGTSVADPARALALNLPIIRLDGIPVDHVTWTALLCAQLEASGRTA